MKPAPEFHDFTSEEARPRDALLNATFARATLGISPTAITLAYLDWLFHLAASPGKQQELVEKGWRKLTRLALYSASTAAGQCIEPLPQDLRFNDPSWQRWPFNLIYQAFLLGQQWCWNATTGVHGVTRHHEDLVTFMTRQCLDMFSPSNFFWTNPEVQQETWRSCGMNLIRGAQNLWEDALQKMSNRPPAATGGYRVGEALAVTPGKVVLRNRVIELIQYAPTTARVRPEPVLIVPSWIMKYYILDLAEDDSLVRYLVDQGYTVFMISWKNPGSEDRDLGMEAYLHSGPFAALAAISKILPGRQVHGLGYCLGGTLLAIAAAAAAREGDDVFASLTLLAAELDFSEPGELGLFTDESQIAFLEDMMWTRGYLDGRDMAGAFAMLRSKDLLWSRLVRDYLMGVRAPPNDLTAWNADATRLPFSMHSEYLRRLYLENELAEGRYDVDGRAVALSDIRVPMFVVGTERDHISPWRSVYQVHLLTDAEVTFVLTTGGHNVGVVNPPAKSVPGAGYRFQTRLHNAKYQQPDLWYLQAERRAGSWWPHLVEWLGKRSAEPVDLPQLGAPEIGLPPLYDAPGRYVLVP